MLVIKAKLYFPYKISSDPEYNILYVLHTRLAKYPNTHI